MNISLKLRTEKLEQTTENSSRPPSSDSPSQTSRKQVPESTAKNPPPPDSPQSQAQTQTERLHLAYYIGRCAITTLKNQISLQSPESP